MAGEVDEVATCRTGRRTPSAVDVGAGDARRARSYERGQRRRPRRRRSAAPGRRRTPPAALAAGRPPRARAAACAAADHALSDGLTDTGRPRSGASARPRHAVQGARRHDHERPVRAGDGRREQLRRRAPSRPRRACARPPSRDASEPWTRLSRCSANEHDLEVLAERGDRSPRSCSGVRPRRRYDGAAAGRRGWRRRAARDRRARSAMRVGDGLLGRRERTRRALRRGPGATAPRISRSTPQPLGGRRPGAPSDRRLRVGRPPRSSRRSSVSSAAIASSSGARTSGACHTIVRIASMRCSSSRGRPSSIGQAGAELDQLGAVVGGVRPRLERAERRPAPRRRRAARR